MSCIHPFRRLNGPATHISRGRRLARRLLNGVPEIEHGPERPSWLCRSCGDPWPCPPTKDDLIATTDRLGILILVNLYLPDLLDDQPQLGAGGAYDRLIWWARGS
jgi:hypothetical protein